MILAEARATGAAQSNLKDRLVRRAVGMKNYRQDFNDHYRELQELFLPRRGNFDEGAPRSRRGKKVNQRILNSSGTLALRTLQSGMQAGITSPARPWFRLIPAELSMRQLGAVRTYTNDVERVLRQYFQSTGTYNALHVSYGDLGLLGTDAAVLDEDLEGGFVLHQLVPGMFWLAANGRNEIDTLYMEDWLTVEQVVGRFVYRNNPRADPDWSVVSQTVKNLWDRGNRYEDVHVARMIEPRKERDPDSISADNKPTASVWWEIGASGTQLLRNSGYDRNPLIASRWYKEGMDVYGRSPGMDALPDVKSLQVMEREKAEAVRRMNRPPMNAPTSMRNSPFSLLPGAVNFTDDQNGLRPAYENNSPIHHMREDIRELEDRVDEAMYANLFMMLSNLDRRQITAREVDERHEEKLIGLGPVLELQHKEKLRPLILGAYSILLKQGKLPETPKELDGQTLTIDYISMLAQAQKAVATGGIERLFAFAGNLSAVKPEVMDKLDADMAIDEYSEMLGTPSRIVRDNDDVAVDREERARAMQQQQQLENATAMAPAMNQGAQAAQVLSQAANTDSPRDVLRRIGVGP